MVSGSIAMKTSAMVASGIRELRELAPCTRTSLYRASASKGDPGSAVIRSVDLPCAYQSAMPGQVLDWRGIVPSRRLQTSGPDRLVTRAGGLQKPPRLTRL